jgi:carbonic anhydrase
MSAPSTPVLCPPASNSSPSTTSPTTSPAKAADDTTLGDLINGYQRFRNTAYLRHEQTYRTLGRSGQNPPTLVIGCADSRCDPSTIFDQPPGELFVIRNVANLVPPYCPDGKLHGVSAALEFAVKCLKVRHVVIMGHGKCGGVCACLQQGEALASGKPSKVLDEASEFLAPWVAMLAEARDRVLASGSLNPQYALELEGIELSIKNLLSFPFVSDAVNTGQLQIHGAWFAIEHGELHWRNPRNQRFEIVPQESILDQSNPNEKELSRSNSVTDLSKLGENMAKVQLEGDGRGDSRGDSSGSNGGKSSEVDQTSV